jgi:hypothetical protein
MWQIVSVKFMWLASHSLAMSEINCAVEKPWLNQNTKWNLKLESTTAV